MSPPSVPGVWYASVNLTHRAWIQKRLALEHCSEGVVSGNALAWAASIFGIGFAVTEREANKEALAHFVVTVGHVLKRLLLIVYLLVFCHVCLVIEVIEVASVGFRVEFGHKRSSRLSQSRPINLSKVLVVVNVVDVVEASNTRVDASATKLVM